MRRALTLGAITRKRCVKVIDVCAQYIPRVLFVCFFLCFPSDAFIYLLVYTFLYVFFFPYSRHVFIIIISFCKSTAGQSPPYSTPTVSTHLCPGFFLPLLSSHFVILSVHQYVITTSHALFSLCHFSNILTNNFPSIFPFFPCKVYLFLWTYHARVKISYDIRLPTLYPLQYIFNPYNTFGCLLRPGEDTFICR